MFDSLHEAFHVEKARSYRTLHFVIGVLVVISITLVLIEINLPDNHSALPWIRALDRTLLLGFAVELVLRVGSYRSPDLGLFNYRVDRRLGVSLMGRLRFCATPMILIDVATVVALLPALRGLRVLRLLRLLQTQKFFQYSSPLAGVARAFSENRLLYTGAFSVLGLATLLGGLTIFLVERRANEQIATVGDGLWWAIVTLTTVGFGDISPITPLGRVVGAALMVVGMFTLALFAGVVGHSLLHSVLSIREEQYRMSSHTNHVVICGYTAGARMLLDTLQREEDWGDREVVLFGFGERPKDVPPAYNWVSGDPTKESELSKVRLTHADGVIVVGSRRVLPQQADATTILTVFTIRDWMSQQPETERRKKPLYVVAEILDVENVEHARAAGASEVIESTLVGFSLVAHAMSMPGSANFLSRLSEASGTNLYVGAIPKELELPATFGLVNQKLRGISGLMLVGVQAADGEQRLNPPDDLPIRSDDRLVYLAESPVLSTV